MLFYSSAHCANRFGQYICAGIFLIVMSLLTVSASAYDYINAKKITTKEESCEMYRKFDLAECEAQAATVSDLYSRPNCKMWHRQKDRVLLDCDGLSPRALEDKKVKDEREALRRDATHVLVDTGRLICRSEKSLRETYNSIINNTPGIPRHIRSNVCLVTDYETIVKITSTSEDGKVVAIDYMNKSAAKRHGFTAMKWLVTKERFKEIQNERLKTEM